MQIVAIGGCWIYFRVPMYCVYGSYAVAVLCMHLFRWPSDEWLRGATPRTIHATLLPMAFDAQWVEKLQDLHGSQKATALFTCNARCNDTKHLTDHIHNMFFLKTVVYIVFILAAVVSTGAASETINDIALKPADWFKAVLLFVILIMGLLWDVAVCFYQRTLNETCHQYRVLIPPADLETALRPNAATQSGDNGNPGAGEVEP